MYKYFALHNGYKEAVEIDRKSAVIQLEGQGCLNGAFRLDNSSKDNPVIGKYAKFWREVNA